ncbi:MAG: hypothetical protein ACR2NY_04465 [Alphaproteobacteria bacterium]
MRQKLNIFGKNAKRRQEAGFQGLIANYFFKRQKKRPSSINATWVPPYRLLYKKPSLRRVGKWLEAQDKFFKRSVLWQNLLLWMIWFGAGIIASSSLLLWLLSINGIDIFKNNSPQTIIQITAQTIKNKSLSIAQKSHRFITSIEQTKIKNTIDNAIKRLK